MMARRIEQKRKWSRCRDWTRRVIKGLGPARSFIFKKPLCRRSSRCRKVSLCLHPSVLTPLILSSPDLWSARHFSKAVGRCLEKWKSDPTCQWSVLLLLSAASSKGWPHPVVCLQPQTLHVLFHCIHTCPLCSSSRPPVSSCLVRPFHWNTILSRELEVVTELVTKIQS